MNAQFISLVSLAVFAVIVLLFALMVLWKIFNDEISLRGLLAEPVDPMASGVRGPAYGKASLARFQFLIFTFVIAGLYLLLSIEAGTFVDIPTNVLGLLGISGGSFLVSKGMSTPSRKTADVETTVEDNPDSTRVVVKS
jgi:hypothetical protein